MLWYSLEVPHQGTSNEYPQHIFSMTDKKCLRNKKNSFSYFSMETYVVGTHKKWLNETLLMGTHNIYFHGEIRKICPDTSYQEQRIMQSCIIEKSGITVYYFLHTNICCEYSLEATHQGTANDTHKYIFIEKLKKYPELPSYTPP